MVVMEGRDTLSLGNVEGQGAALGAARGQFYGI